MATYVNFNDIYPISEIKTKKYPDISIPYPCQTRILKKIRRNVFSSLSIHYFYL